MQKWLQHRSTCHKVPNGVRSPDTDLKQTRTYVSLLYSTVFCFANTHLHPDPRMSRLRHHNTSPSLQPPVTPSPSRSQIVPAKERSPSSNPPSSSLLPHTCMHPCRLHRPPSISSATSTRTTSSPHMNPVVGTLSSGPPLSGRIRSSVMWKPTEFSARYVRNGCN